VDLVDNPDSIALIRVFLQFGQAGLQPSVIRQQCSIGYLQGAPIVKGKRVTGFTNGEEEAVHLTNVVPFWSRMS